jgi:hypothetical protein
VLRQGRRGAARRPYRHRPEIKFGYSVTGGGGPGRILTNASARVGDTLVLTKPLGTGIVVRARKYGQGTDDQLAAAVASMKQLNDEAALRFGHCPKDRSAPVPMSQGSGSPAMERKWSGAAA